MGERKVESYTIDEYLALEQRTQLKHEFIDGQVYAMSGGTVNHGIISSNTLFAIQSALNQQKKNCLTLNSDVKVAVTQKNSYLYPDVFVVCGEIEKEKEAIKNPTLIIEVLSKSTQGYDQTKKFRLYRTIPSFQEYVLIDQEQAIAEIFFRETESSWQIATIQGLENNITLTSLNISLKMADIYQHVSF